MTIFQRDMYDIYPKLVDELVLKDGKLRYNANVTGHDEVVAISNAEESSIISLFTGDHNLSEIIRGFNPELVDNVIKELHAKNVLMFSRKGEVDRVDVVLTNRCNLRCAYCYNHSGENPPNELSIDQWFMALDILRKNGVAAVTFTGGEPFVKEGVWDILAYASEHFFTSVLTNGMIIGKTCNEFGKKEEGILRDLRYVQLSIDSLTSEIHDKYRGEGSHEAVMGALRYLKGIGAYPLMSMTVHKENYDQIAKLKEFSRQLGVAFSSGSLEPRGRAKDMGSLLVSGYKKEPSHMKWGDCAALHGYFGIQPNGMICPCIIPNLSEYTSAFQEKLFYDAFTIFDLQDGLRSCGHYNDMLTLIMDSKGIRRPKDCSVISCEYSKLCDICSIAYYFLKKNNLCKMVSA